MLAGKGCFRPIAALRDRQLSAKSGHFGRGGNLKFTKYTDNYIDTMNIVLLRFLIQPGKFEKLIVVRDSTWITAYLKALIFELTQDRLKSLS